MRRDALLAGCWGRERARFWILEPGGTGQRAASARDLDEPHGRRTFREPRQLLDIGRLLNLRVRTLRLP